MKTLVVATTLIFFCALVGTVTAGPGWADAETDDIPQTEGPGWADTLGPGWADTEGPGWADSLPKTDGGGCEG